MSHSNRYDFIRPNLYQLFGKAVGLHSFKEKQRNLTQDGFSKRPMRGNKTKKACF